MAGVAPRAPALLLSLSEYPPVWFEKLSTSETISFALSSNYIDLDASGDKVGPAGGLILNSYRVCGRELTHVVRLEASPVNNAAPAGILFSCST